jgi:hypothetical protein
MFLPKFLYVNTFYFPSVSAGKKKSEKWLCFGLDNRMVVLFRVPEYARDLSLLQGFQTGVDTILAPI